MGRRQHLTWTIALGLLIFISVSYLLSSHGSPGGSAYPSDNDRTPADGSPSDFKLDLDAIPAGILDGESIAPKLENATLKYVQS